MTMGHRNGESMINDDDDDDDDDEAEEIFLCERERELLNG